MGRHVRVRYRYVEEDAMNAGEWLHLESNERVLAAERLTFRGPRYVWRFTVLMDPA